MCGPTIDLEVPASWARTTVAKAAAARAAISVLFKGDTTAALKDAADDAGDRAIETDAEAGPGDDGRPQHGVVIARLVERHGDKQAGRKPDQQQDGENAAPASGRRAICHAMPL